MVLGKKKEMRTGNLMIKFKFGLWEPLEAIPFP